MAELRQEQVLFVAKDGALSPMVVVALEGNRVNALDAEGEEHWLAVKRVFWISEHQVDSHEKLPAYWQTVVRLSEGIDLPPLWTSLSESERDAPLGLSELLVKLDLGREVSGADAFVLAVFEHSLHFKIRQRRLLISTPEQVQVALEKAAEKERARIAFEEAKSWLLMALDGQHTGAPPHPVEDHLEAIKAVALFGRDASLSRKGIELLNAVLDDPRDPAVVALEVLCSLGIYASNENLIPHRANLKRTFPEDVLKELQAGKVQSAALAGRHDMTHLRTLSIDDMQTREIDDAFALEGNRLHVFIADVSHFIPIGSQLDQEAAKRLSTVYIPEGKIPMLPSVIGEELASLNQSETRPALCFSGTIDDQGGFSEVELREVLCSVDHRLDYSTVDMWLATGDGEAELMPTLRALESWSESHLDRRVENGAMVFQRNELYPRLDDVGRVYLHQPDANGPSRLLIAEMMVAICCQAARYLRDQKLPGIYRGQAPPDREIDLSQMDLTDPSVEYELLRSVKPSALSLYPKPHAALGAVCYAQVSSPIRRYADLLMHRQMKACLQGNQAPYDLDSLGSSIRDIEQRQGVIRRVERESNRYWLLRYLEQKPDMELDAVVLRRLKRRYLVNLPALCMPATILSRGRLVPGQVLRMRITEVDARNDVLVLDEA